MEREREREKMKKRENRKALVFNLTGGWITDYGLRITVSFFVLIELNCKYDCWIFFDHQRNQRKLIECLSQLCFAVFCVMNVLVLTLATRFTIS